MKKLCMACTAILLFPLFTACGREAVVTAPAATSVVWAIATPEPKPAPSIDVDLSNAQELGYVEIDIDANDGYRDFVLEHWLSDQYGESTFFRLIDGKYVELGTLDDYVTDQIGTPHITLDGVGYLYVNESSSHLGWARIDRIYTVADNRLTEVPPLNHVYYPIEEYEFDVLDTVLLYTTGFTTEEMKALSPEDAPAFDWEKIGGAAYGKRKVIGKGDSVTVFGTDEQGNVLLDFKGTAYLLPMTTEDMTDVYCDLLAEGRFFNECFYNKYTEDYYHRG